MLYGRIKRLGAPMGAELLVLVIGVIAIIYVVQKGTAAKPASACAGASFWTLPDGAAVPTKIACQSGAITVQNAAFGAPWSGGAAPCQWFDVTDLAGNLMNGKSTYTIPAGANLVSLLRTTDACPGVVKTFGGAYTCA